MRITRTTQGIPFRLARDISMASARTAAKFKVVSVMKAPLLLD